jgi:hypothetical protein
MYIDLKRLFRIVEYKPPTLNKLGETNYAMYK